MEYTSTLKKITKVESWVNKKDNKNWTKYRFDFANGHNPFVFRTDDLHYQIALIHIQTLKMIYKNISLGKVA